MKGLIIKTSLAIFTFAVIGCGGCKRKVQDGSAAAAPEEETVAAGQAAQEEEASAEAPPSVDIQNVYWSQVAGKFYPMFKEEIESMISKYMKDTSPVAELKDRDIVGFISPHAGYVFSGPVAAWGYRQIQDRKISSVVILGFNHGGSPSVSSILPYDGYKTPLGVAPVDKEIRDELLESGKGVLKASKTPFGGEHSLETQIPFIQKVLPGVSIVPIMVAHPGGEVDEGLAKLLYETLGKRKDVVFVASTDLSHYMSYDNAVKTDTETLKWIAGLRWDQISKEGIGSNRICGYFTTGVLMKLLEHYESKDKKGTLIKYANSGDTSGDKSKGVVGYGVVAFSLPGGIRTETHEAASPAAGQAGGSQSAAATPVISDEDKNFLEKVAKATIAAVLKHESYTPEKPKSSFPGQTLGSIVVIEIDGRIHGTGKELSLTRPLYQSVAEAAKNAVLEDARYPTPSAEKISSMKISIFTVSELVPLQELKVDNFDGDGLIIQSRKGEGILLPQEAASKGWKNEEALKHGCRRANLMNNCYNEKNIKQEKIIFTALKGVAL